MDSPEHSHNPAIGKWITLTIWGFGFALLFARRWLCTLFHLNTEMYFVSFVGPLWAFMLVCVLAGFLRLFRRPAEKWSNFWRAVFAVVPTLLLMLPQADLIMILREGWHFPQRIDLPRLIISSITALMFYITPAAIVVLSWLRHNRLVSTARALGLALVTNGLLYVPFGLWLNQLIGKYTQP